MNCRKLYLISLSVCALQAQNYVVKTVAGHSLSAEGQPAIEDFLRSPTGIAADSAGNIYFSDTGDNRVWKIDTTGKATTFAGNGIGYFSGDGKAASAATLSAPTDIAVDSSNNVYILDAGDFRIRKIDSTGNINTVAGSGSGSSSGDNGPALNAGMSPGHMAVDKSGNIYLSDGFRVRKVTASTGIITPFAGTGTSGTSSDGGPATGAEFTGISGIAADASGNVYIADYGACKIRKVNSSNVISTPFGTGNCSYSGDGGLASAAGMDPGYIALDPSASTLTFGEVNQSLVRQINLASGKIVSIAGVQGKFSFTGDAGPATSATLDGIEQIYVDGSENVYLCDYFNHRVRKITASNSIINTIAGTSVNDGPATSAFLDHPIGLAFDPTGKLNIADSGDDLVRQLNLTSGNISSISTSFSSPEGIASDSAGNLYVGGLGFTVYRISTTGTVTSIAGTGTSGYSGDGGPATKAQISTIYGIAVDSAGNVYLAEVNNHVVRRIDTSGNISTVAGNGKAAYAGEGGPAASASLSPWDVAVDKSGNVYVADAVNNRIEKFQPGGNISTIAGTGTAGYSGYPGPATQATMVAPTGVAVDSAGNVYFCATYGLVNVINSSGIISTIAGDAVTYPFNGDGPASMVNLDAFHIAVSASGGIYVTDYANDRVRQIVAITPASIAIVSGNNQSAAAGSQLPQPLVVKVTGNDGNPFAGASVTFSAANGATFNPTTVTTAADGTASTVATLGATAGTVNVLATVTGVAPVAFAETATAGVPMPTIAAGGIVSAGLSTPAIQAASPNAILSIFGQNFAPAGTLRKVSGGDLVNGLVPTNLIGVCVMFGGQPAPVFLVSPGQLNVQAPQLPASGSVAVQVITGCGTASASMSNSVSVAVQTAAPEFFYAANNPNGQNPVAAADGVTQAGVGDPSRLGAGFALGYPGEVVVIYATGLGVSNPPYGPGVLPPVASSVGNVTVTIDGSAVDPSIIQYVGVTPENAGLYQLNLQLPAGIAPGDHTIAISVNGVSSPAGPYLSTGAAPM